MMFPVCTHFCSQSCSHSKPFCIYVFPLYPVHSTHTHIQAEIGARRNGKFGKTVGTLGTVGTRAINSSESLPYSVPSLFLTGGNTGNTRRPTT